MAVKEEDKSPDTLRCPVSSVKVPKAPSFQVDESGEETVSTKTPKDND